MSEGVIAAVAQCPKLMPVFHIPAQSGDDAVLARMGRGYTAARYLEIVGKIRKAIPRTWRAHARAHVYSILSQLFIPFFKSIL